ncbi:carotenoid biosynthesis protein [Micromonospora sp. NPDC050397]|uniref:carotenoid biosynthesis protein n=1 Tax=Micromonospora sp. NPDC050397 TaxID=3364279 RepID=UPI00384C496F
MWVLWVAVAVDAVVTFVPLPLPGLLLTVLSLLAELVFAVVHGLLFYRCRGVLMFVLLALVVSNALENLGVLTGVPFGNYHYTDDLGPKLFLVPVLIGPAYFAIGYAAWVIGTILFGEVRRGSRWLVTVGTPLIASFVMVAWDLSMDPQSSTLRGRWFWEDGGGFFGVPLSNFLGWSVTVYLFYQLFALYQRRWGAQPKYSEPLPRSYWLLPVLAYTVVALDYVVTYLTGGHDGVPTQVTDATGHVWHAADIYETSALMAIYTMLFLAIFAALKIAQRPRATDRPEPVQAGAVDTPAGCANEAVSATPRAAR